MLRSEIRGSGGVPHGSAMNCPRHRPDEYWGSETIPLCGNLCPTRGAREGEFMSACQCPGCGLWLSADVPAGQPVRCPRCQTAFTGVGPGAAAAAATATLAPAPASVSPLVSAP